jgi:hypothetical protein
MFSEGYAEHKGVDMGTIRVCAHCGGSFAGTLAVCPEDSTPLFAPEVVARIGMRLKDHEILGVIGEGGMGVVYRAQHVVLEKPVAIKVMHEQFAKQTESVEQSFLRPKRPVASPPQHHRRHGYRHDGGRAGLHGDGVPRG